MNNKQIIFLLSFILLLHLTSCEQNNKVDKNSKDSIETTSEFQGRSSSQQISNIRSGDSIRKITDSSEFPYYNILYNCETIDKSFSSWESSSKKLAKDFLKYVTNGVVTDKFYDDFGLNHEDINKPSNKAVRELVKSLIEVSKKSPKTLQKLLLEKSQNSNQSASDLIIYVVAQSEISEYPSVHKAIGFEEIELLNQVDNPIYRLLAAKTIPLLETNKGKLINYLSSYTQETDELIITSVIDTLVNINSLQSMEIVREIIEENEDISYSLKQYAKSMIEKK